MLVMPLTAILDDITFRLGSTSMLGWNDHNEMHSGTPVRADANLTAPA